MSVYIAGNSIKPALRDLVVALREVNWYQLGTQLDVPQEELERIEEERGVSRRLNMMLHYWLKNAETPSWEKIIKALERMKRHGNLIIELRSTYCSTPLNQLVSSMSSLATVTSVNGKRSINSHCHAEVIASSSLSLHTAVWSKGKVQKSLV